MQTHLIQKDDLPHYTYAEYREWEGRWELIFGIPFAMTPMPAKKHQRLSGEIFTQLKEQLKTCPRCDVMLPVDWPISEDTVVQPDIIIVCDENPEGATLEKTPAVVFEILSPSTRKKDRGIKYKLYEAAGVKYYCIVDPDTNSLDVFVLQNDRFVGDLNPVIPFDLGPCRISLDIKRLFTPT